MSGGRFAGALAVIIFLATACGSVQTHRARQHPETMQSLDAEVRARILDGVIRPGDRREAVYVAFGSPEYAEYPDSDVEEWVYLGVVLRETHAPRSLAFAGRSALRIPSPGEERQRLAVRLENGRVTGWSLRTPDREDIGRLNEVGEARMPAPPGSAGH